MSGDDIKKVLAKIAKCMRLSASSNPHEAAAAMRQAQALMKKYGLSERDLMLEEVGESKVTSGSRSRPPVWMMDLNRLVQDAFGVESFLELRRGVNHYVFVGTDHAAEIAGYTFTILRRKLVSARRDYVALLRGKPASRARKGDIFAAYWVIQVGKTVTAFARPVTSIRAINNYIAARHPGLAIFQRNQPKMKPGDSGAAVAGMLAAKQVVLRYGMDGADCTLIEHKE